MKIEQFRFTKQEKLNLPLMPNLGEKAQLVIIFSDINLLKEEKYLEIIKKKLSQRHSLGMFNSRGDLQ